MIAALVYFLVVMLAMGFAAWRLLGVEEEDDSTKVFLWLATGILVFVIAGTVLGLVGQANWVAYLLLAVILLAAAYWKTGMKSGVTLRLPAMSWEWKLVCLLFVVHLAVYVSGTFAYPWLEDDDPWDHAAGVHYVSLFGSYIQPTDLPLHYLAPYTPFYDVLMGVLFQLDGSSMQFILKFFNALLISLSIPLFFCWAKERLGSRNALWATFALAILPSFMSHFIWAQTLSMMLVFPALYFIEKFSKDGGASLRSGFCILAVLSVAAVCITQPSTAAMFCGLLALYIAALALTDLITSRTVNLAKIRPPFIALFGGLLLSIALYWGPMFAMYPVDVLLPHIGLNAGLLTSPTADTSGGVVYGLGDFIDAPTASKIDQPTGFGPAMALLLAMGMIAAFYALRSTETRDTAAIALLWLAYGLVGTEGNLLPVKLFPHRFWVFLAIPVAILAGYGIVKSLEYLEKNKKSLVIVAKVAIVAALLYTSAYPKCVVETAQWPPGTSWASTDQLSGYLKLQGLPANTKVFDFCMRDEFADGIDMSGYQWIKEVSDYKTQSMNDTLDGNYAFLKKYGYEYAVIDQSCLKTFTNGQVTAKLTAISRDSRFTLLQQFSNKALITLKVG